METNLVQKDYKVFEGSYNSKMPLLVNEGLQPLTAKDVMQYRINAFKSKDKDEFDFWLDHYWDTITGLVYYNENLIVQPNSQLLLNVNPESKLDNGSLILTPEQFKELSKKHGVLKRKKVISNKNLTKREVKEHPIWLKLAQDDKSLLNEYADLIFSKAKEIYNYEENMGVYLPDDQKNPALRSWCLGNLDYRSDAYARLDLNRYTRWFGVRAQNFGSILEKLVQEEGLKNPEEVRKAIKLYKITKELMQ